MISHLYRSIAQALAQNKYTLETSSSEFQEVTKTFRNKNSKPTDKEQNIIRFALKKAARMVHHVPMEYNIVTSMREELDFLQSI